MKPFSLDALDWRGFEVFTVASQQFWFGLPAREGYRSVVVQFFAQLQRIGSAGFLVSHALGVCNEATELHGIPCVFSRNFSRRSDSMMSMERWRVIEHFMARGRPIVCAGADVRFVQSIRSMQTAMQSAVHVDAAFEAAALLYSGGGTVRAFTPDLILAWPTPRTVEFVRQVLAELRASPLQGLPMEMQQKRLLKYRTELVGPAQQDLLMDVLLSALHGKPVFLRRTALARELLRLTSERQQLRRGPRIDERADVRARKGLGKLHVARTPHGPVLQSPHFAALMTSDASTVTAFAPCAPRKCARWSPRLVYALHCLGKHPGCLNVSQCDCPGTAVYWPHANRTHRHQNGSEFRAFDRNA